MLLLACASPLDSGADSAPTALAEPLILGPDGGTLDLGGARLEVPEGALADTVELQVGDLEGWPELPLYADELRLGLSITPALELQEPATLVLPHGGWTERLALLHSPAPDLAWSLKPGLQRSDDDTTLAIDQLGGFALITLHPCPCLDATTFRAFRDLEGWTTHAARVDGVAQLSQQQGDRFAFIGANDQGPGDLCIARVFDVEQEQATDLFQELLGFPPGGGDDKAATHFLTSLTMQDNAACFAMFDNEPPQPPATALVIQGEGLGGVQVKLHVDGASRAWLREGLNEVGPVPEGAVLTLSAGPEGCTLDGQPTLTVPASTVLLEPTLRCDG